MCVGSAHDGCLEQSVVFVYGLECLSDESDEPEVVDGVLPWSVQQDARVGG